MTTPTTEKTPVTKAIPDTGIFSPPPVTTKSTPMALGKRCDQGGGRHRCDRGDQASASEPAEWVGRAFDVLGVSDSCSCRSGSVDRL